MINLCKICNTPLNELEIELCTECAFKLYIGISLSEEVKTLNSKLNHSKITVIEYNLKLDKITGIIGEFERSELCNNRNS